ncbi:MAG: S-adenosylmethionine decarboxylase [Dehalococcoidia bacterium]
MHLIVDGYGGDVVRLWDADALRRFLDTCPESIGMTKISEPSVLHYQGSREEDGGVSGFVLIAESHISVHTFPVRRYVNVDVFSCRSFDAQRVLAEIRELFALEELRNWVLDRGVEYLDAPHALAEIHRKRARLRLSR